MWEVKGLGALCGERGAANDRPGRLQSSYIFGCSLPEVLLKPDVLPQGKARSQDLEGPIFV